MRVKNVLKVVLASLLLFGLLVFGVGQVLADHWEVATERTLDAPPAKVAPLLLDLRAWLDWADLEVELGAPTRHETNGAAGAAGQAIVWRGPVGEARCVLTAVGADSLDYRWTMQAAGAAAANELTVGHIAWRADGARTVVSWREGRHLDSLEERWFAWFGAQQERIKAIQGSGLEGLQLHLTAK